MGTITIYDSKGRAYGTGEPGSDAELIKTAFRSRVRVWAERKGGVRLLVFFRAREFESGRAEQFFAVYETTQTRNLAQGFMRELSAHVEEELGLTIAKDTDDMEHLRALPKHPRDSELPGGEFERSILNTLLSRGHRLRYGVRDAEGAVGLFNQVFGDDAHSVVIAEETDAPEFESVDLCLELGNQRDLEPLGETAELDADARGPREQEFVDARIAVIREEIRSLRSQTEIADGELRDRLKREIDLVIPQSHSSPGGNAYTSTSRHQSSRIDRLLNRLGPIGRTVSRTTTAFRRVGIAFLALVIAAVILIIAANLVTIVIGGAPAAAAPLLIVDTEPTIEDVTIYDAEVGEKSVGLATTSLNLTSDVPVYVNGTTDQPSAFVEVRQPQTDETVSVSVETDVSDGQFSAPLDPVSEDFDHGETELYVAVGENAETEPAVERTWDLSIHAIRP